MDLNADDYATSKTPTLGVKWPGASCYLGGDVSSADGRDSQIRHAGYRPRWRTEEESWWHDGISNNLIIYRINHKEVDDVVNQITTHRCKSTCWGLSLLFRPLRDEVGARVLMAEGWCDADEQPEWETIQLPAICPAHEFCWKPLDVVYQPPG